MRIGIIAPPWVPIPPPAYGGIEAVIDSLARGLLAAGHDVLLHASAESMCPVPRTADTLSAQSLLGAAGPAAELSHVVTGYEAMRDWAPDIVHDHTMIGPAYMHRPDIPVVTTNHGPFTRELAACYRIVSGAVPVIAISNHQAATADGVPIAAVIHHGLDTDTVDEGGGEGGYALFLGRMTPDKGVDAAARIARAAGIPLRIASRLSEPAEHEFYRSAVEPLLGGDVRYVGEVGGAEKSALLGGAACLLNPLAWPEPFGMVMIEALARGTPVVATPCGSVPELIEDGVTGFVRSTEAELARALPEVGSLDRATCRRVAVERFSTARMVADHVALYERFADGRHPLRVA
jgi:glycosyltransferase involved in cell wall biosynthesis